MAADLLGKRSFTLEFVVLAQLPKKDGLSCLPSTHPQSTEAQSVFHCQIMISNHLRSSGKDGKGKGKDGKGKDGKGKKGKGKDGKGPQETNDLKR